MRKVAILLGSWAHPRSVITWKALPTRYEAVVFAGKRCAYFEDAKLQLPVQHLLTVRDAVSRIPKLRNNLGWGADQYIFGLEKALESFDIVLSSSPTCLFSYQAARFCDRTNKPLVLQEIEVIPFIDQDRRIYPHRVHALKTARIISPSTARANAKLILEGVPESKLRIVPFGIDTELFHPRARESGMRSELGFAENQTLMLFAGRIEWAKGIYDFVHAARLMEADRSLKNRHIHFLIAGDGPERADIEQRIQQLGLADRVHLLPRVPFERMPELYAAADVVVAPSVPIRTWLEQWCLVLSEAMSVGTPVIATCTGAIPEVMGDAGIMTQPADPLSLADAMKTLADDPALRESMGKAGRARVMDLYDWRVVGNQWADLLDQVG